MTDRTFKLKIITPNRVVYSGEVESFSAPGVMGGFQVLYNHAPLLAEIEIGEVKFREPNGKEIFYATSGGFVEVINNETVMLAETAERFDEIDITRAEAARERARQLSLEKLTEHETAEIKSALKRSLNRIRIAEKR